MNPLPLPDPNFYSAEAALPPDSPSYVERAADAELLRALLERKFAIMLSSRKVGKSSLLEKTFSRLRKEGVLVAKKELASAGESVTEEGWYIGLVNELVNDAKRRNQFTAAPEWRAWWDEHAAIPAGQRFVDFLRTFFLEVSTVPWVIAIDEIDTTIPLSYSDDFFAALRSCQNARAADPVFGRLTFLLSGVASPAQLIKDNRRTPFNVGYAVGLTDFTAEEAKGLLRGLGLPEQAGHPALAQVLDWTGGHPYLTQMIFLRLAELLSGDVAERIDWPGLVRAVVHATFVRPGARTTVAHFHDIVRRRIGALPGAEKRRILVTYHRALRGKKVKDDALAAHIVELKLCGLLVRDPGNPALLVVRNRIYRTVFDETWVREEMPRKVWQAVGAASVLTLALALGAVLYQADRAEKATIAALVVRIAGADKDVPSAAVAELKAIKGQEKQANKLLGQYWAGKARATSVEGPRDEAALLWLKALAVDETPEARLQARNALAGSLPQIAVTFQASPYVVALSRDERRLVTATNARPSTLQVWDAESGLPLGKPTKFDGTVLSIEFSPDGRRFVTTGMSNKAQLWDTETGLQSELTIQHQNRVKDAAFSPDGLRLVTASDDKTASLWDANTGAPVGKPMQHDSEVNNATFSLDGRLIVTVSADNTARLWSGFDGQSVGKPMHHQDKVKQASFSPGGRRVVTASDDGTARLWNAATGDAIGQPMKHHGAVRRATFSPDGRSVATSGADGVARLWDGETGEELGKPLRRQASIRYTGFHPNGRQLFTASNETVQLWDIASGAPLGKPLEYRGTIGSGNDMPLFVAEGQRMLTLGERPRMWQPESTSPMGKRIRHKDGFLFAMFNPDGQRLLAAARDNTVRLWNVDSGQQFGNTMQNQQSPKYMAFSMNGTKLIATSSGTVARLWDAETGVPFGKPLEHPSRVTQVAFSPVGHLLATACDDKRIRLWNTVSGDLVGTTLDHEDDVNVFQIAFSQDGQRLIAAGQQLIRPKKTTLRRRIPTGYAQLWDIGRATQIGKPILPNVGIKHTAFSPDGRQLVTSSDFGPAQLWDLESGQAIGKPFYHHEPIKYAAFSQDGRRLITRTDRTLNWFSVAQNGDWMPEKTVWANAEGWASDPVPTDASASTLRIAESWAGDPLIRTISLSTPEPDLPELRGTAAELLKKYQRTFARRFENEQKSPNTTVGIHGNLFS